MKYIFVGDIHGKVEQVEKALSISGKKVFVGDFQDSYNRPTEDHARCLDLVMDAIEKGEAEAMYGNHELSYFRSGHSCSGWDRWRAALFRERQVRLTGLFKPFLIINKNWLVSHAGLTLPLWESHGLTLDNLEERLTEWWKDDYSPMHWVGYTRGGRHSIGGLFWCHFTSEFTPVPGLNQIFGHTRASKDEGIRTKVTDTSTSYCIDVLDHHPGTFLELDL
jgi:hypothetical protein